MCVCVLGGGRKSVREGMKTENVFSFLTFQFIQKILISEDVVQLKKTRPSIS